MPHFFRSFTYTSFGKTSVPVISCNLRFPLVVLAAAASVFVFGVWLFQVTRSAWCNDECAHIPAGLYHLETGRMDAYHVNPPLHRMVAALPLLIHRPKIDWHYSDSPYVRSEFQFARSWVKDNAGEVQRFLLLSRSTVLIFFAFGLWTIARWTHRLYGPASAWLAAILWSFNPDIITNAAIVTPDLPAAATGLICGYVFWNWLGQDDRRFPWSVAAAVALAVLCKFSWLFLLLALPMITFAFDVVQWMRLNRSQSAASHETLAAGSRLTIFRDTIRLLLSFSLTVLIVNWCYGFDGTGTRLGDFLFISKSFAGQDLAYGDTGNRFADGWLAWIPVPLPSEMVRGVDFLKWEFERGRPSYLRGAWQDRGWWYFHLYAMAVKLPLGYSCLVAGGLGSLAWQWFRGGLRFSREWLPVIFAALFIALISSQTGFTHHVRYVVPAYGFLFITASRIMVILPRPWATTVVVVCLSGTVWFHATHLGLAHTFFNPLAGGPNNGWRHLGSSNVDWGQSAYRMANWVKTHPAQRPMTVLFQRSPGDTAYLVADQEEVFTAIGWREQDSELDRVPTRSGWFLISSRRMTLRENRYFWDKTPIAQPYPDVLLFHVTGDEP